MVENNPFAFSAGETNPPKRKICRALPAVLAGGADGDDSIKNSELFSSVKKAKTCEKPCKHRIFNGFIDTYKSVSA